MNKKLGIYSSGIAAICTMLFAIGLLSRNSTLSFFVCLLLSWAYVLATCAYSYYAKEDRKAVAYAGAAIAVIYSVFTNLVYFSQLTTVAYGTADNAVINAINFRPGSWIFGFDLLGYGLMALSTFLIGLTVEPNNKKDKWMKTMLLLHGIFFPVCVIGPMLNLFKAGADDSAGVIGLLVWCIYFTPIMVLSTLHFKNIK
jgi:hypothetical protein